MSYKHYILLSLCLLLVSGLRHQKAFLNLEATTSTETATSDTFTNVNGIVFVQGLDFGSPLGDISTINPCSETDMINYMKTAPANHIVIYGKELGICWVKNLMKSGQPISQPNRVVAMKGVIAQTFNSVVSVAGINFGNPAGDIAGYNAPTKADADNLARQHVKGTTIAVYSSNYKFVWIKDITKSAPSSSCVDCTVYFGGNTVFPENDIIDIDGWSFNGYTYAEIPVSGFNSFATTARDLLVQAGYSSWSYLWSAPLPTITKRNLAGINSINSDPNASLLLRGQKVSEGNGILAFNDINFENPLGDLASFACTSYAQAVTIAAANLNSSEPHKIACWVPSAQRVWIKDIRKSGQAVAKPTYTVFMLGVHKSTLL